MKLTALHFVLCLLPFYNIKVNRHRQWGLKKGYLSNSRKEDREIDRVRKKRQQTVKGVWDKRGQDPWGLRKKARSERSEVTR